MVTPLQYYDLVETLPKPGCAFCALLVRDVSQYLDALLYEYVNERDTHRTIRAARGLCSGHGEQLLAFSGNSLGIAILYRAALDEAMQITARTAPDASADPLRRRRGNGTALADKLAPAGPCPACTFLEDTERHYAEVFSALYEREALRGAFRESSGLCLPHLRVVARHMAGSTLLSEMLSAQQAIWARLKAELELFQDRSSTDRRHEPMGVERDSWQRAIRLVSGDERIFGLRRR